MSRSNGPPQLPPQRLDTQHSRAGMPYSTASPVCVIPPRNELQQKVKPAALCCCCSSQVFPALSAAVATASPVSWLLHALFKSSSPILNAFGEMPV